MFLKISTLKVLIVRSGIKIFPRKFRFVRDINDRPYRSLPQSFYRKIYVKCIESLEYFYSIEIRSMPRSFLCFAIVAGFGGPPRRSCRVFLSHKGVRHISMSKNVRYCPMHIRVRVNFETMDTGHRSLLLKLI